MKRVPTHVPRLPWLLFALAMVLFAAHVSLWLRAPEPRG